MIVHSVLSYLGFDPIIAGLRWFVWPMGSWFPPRPAAKLKLPCRFLIATQWKLR
jgi:hypothetical protein